MAQLLFYQNAVQISRQRHAGLFIQPVTDYSFTKKANAVPIVVGEITRTALEYPILFTGETVDKVMPSALLGFESNACVDESGRWTKKYIPGFIRRYPFVFSSNDDGKNFMLCIDQDYAGNNKEGKGEQVLTDEGEGTPYLTRTMDFLKAYQQHFAQSKVFCQHLADLNLLDRMRAEVTSAAGKKTQLRGFWAINRDRLRALPAAKLSELARSGELELAYAHLISLNHFGIPRDPQQTN